MNPVEDASQQGAANNELLEPFVRAYNEYTEVFAPAWDRFQAQQDAATAYEEYAAALQELGELAIQERMAEAWNRYASAIKEAIADEEAPERYQVGFQAYLKAVKQGWEQLDPQNVDSQTLAAVSQSLGLASWLAATAQGSVQSLSESSSLSPSQ